MQINELDPINLAALANPLGELNEVGQMCECARHSPEDWR